MAGQDKNRTHDALRAIADLAAAGRVWEYHGPQVGWVPLALPPCSRPACTHPRPERGQP